MDRFKVTVTRRDGKEEDARPPVQCACTAGPDVHHSSPPAPPSTPTDERSEEDRVSPLRDD